MCVCVFESLGEEISSVHIQYLSALVPLSAVPFIPPGIDDDEYDDDDSDDESCWQHHVRSSFVP